MTPPTLGAALRVWVRVALLSFGGPAGQISVMHRIVVEEKKWVSESRFLNALNYCMLLPGPEAQQLATYLGWMLHRTLGGLIAGGLFIVPGFISILVLSVLYSTYRDLVLVEGIFYGLKPAVLAIVVAALLRIGAKALDRRSKHLVALLAFVGIFFFDAPFPLLILAAAAFGLLMPQKFRSALPAAGDDELDPPDRPLLRSTILTALIWASVWLLPVLLIVALLGRGQIFSELALFFSTVAMVTFGGAYAILAFVAQTAVETHGWLAPGEMLDGLGMAETTPGPLIQVVQFVGYMGAFRDAGALHPITAGVIGSVITTWVTFAPSFLWIFVGAPYVESLRRNRRLQSALSAITAAVVGVILNLALWFALHVIFGEIVEWRGPAGRLLVPVWNTLDPFALAIAIGSFFALLRFRLGMLTTLALAIVAGIVIRLLF
jgi:chromate transporter